MPEIDKNIAPSVVAALGRVSMAGDALADAAQWAPSDPDESMGDILTNLRFLIGGDRPPPESAERAAEKEADALRRVATGMEDGHLAAFVAACRWEAIQPPSCDVLTLLLCLLPDERCQMLAALFRDEVDAAIESVARIDGIPLAELVALRTALSEFRDGAVYRPVGEELARIVNVADK